jgi:hypothetical protein
MEESESFSKAFKLKLHRPATHNQSSLSSAHAGDIVHNKRPASERS